MSDIDNNTAITPRKYGFQKGNPGRPPGPNKRTQFLAAIGKSNADAIVKKTIEQALLGKSWAIEACLARLFPPAKNRTVTFPMEEIRSIEDIGRAYSGLWAAVSQGTLSPDEAVSLSAMLRDHAAVLGDMDLEARIAALESAEERRQM
jgi:hypothetical protein